MGRLSRGIQAIDFIPVDAQGGTISWGGVGGMADTGATVTPELSLTVSAVWRGINVISNSIATLPLITYRRTDTGRERAEDDPRFTLLHDQPNPEMSSFTWRQTVQGHVLTWGQGYSEIVRDSFSRPVELWPLRPDKMVVERERLTPEQIVRGLRPRKRYRYTLPDGTLHTFAPSQILHVKGLGFDGHIGYPILTLMRNGVGLATATEQFGSATFKNGARPAIVLTHPGHLSERARRELREDWDEKYGGLTNAQRTAVLEEGVSVEQVGFPPDDAQFLQTRGFQVVEFARWIGVPPHKLYELSRATFSNIEWQSLEYLTDSVNPWLVNWEMQCWLDLFGDRDVYPEFERNAIMQIDARSRAEYYTKLWGVGAINADYIADRENTPRPPDGQGSRYFVPMNYVPVEDAGAAAAAGPVPVPLEPAAESLKWDVMDMAGRVDAIEAEMRNGSDK